MAERHSEKVYTEAIGCYVSKEVKEQFEKMAKYYNMSKSDLLRETVDRAIEDFEDSIKNESTIL